MFHASSLYPLYVSFCPRAFVFLPASHCVPLRVCVTVFSILAIYINWPLSNLFASSNIDLMQSRWLLWLFPQPFPTFSATLLSCASVRMRTCVSVNLYSHKTWDLTSINLFFLIEKKQWIRMSKSYNETVFTSKICKIGGRFPNSDTSDV